MDAELGKPSGRSQRRVDGGRPTSSGRTEHGAGTGHCAADAALAGLPGRFRPAGTGAGAVWLFGRHFFGNAAFPHGAGAGRRRGQPGRADFEPAVGNPSGCAGADVRHAGGHPLGGGAVYPPFPAAAEPVRRGNHPTGAGRGAGRPRIRHALPSGKAFDRAGGGGRQAPRLLRLCRCPDRSGARHPPGAGRAPHRRRDGGRAGGVRGNLRLLLRRHGVGECVLLRRPAVLCLPPPVRACGRGTAGEKHIGFCPGGWTGSGGVPRPVGRRGRCRTFECPGYISGNLPSAGLPLRKGGAGNHWQTLRLDAESFRLSDRPAGGMPPVLFPQVRPSGAGAEGSRHRPGGIRNLCPCGAGKFRPPHWGTGGIP